MIEDDKGGGQEREGEEKEEEGQQQRHMENRHMSISQQRDWLTSNPLWRDAGIYHFDSGPCNIIGPIYLPSPTQSTHPLSFFLLRSSLNTSDTKYWHRLNFLHLSLQINKRKILWKGKDKFESTILSMDPDTPYRLTLLGEQLSPCSPTCNKQ